MLLYAPDPLFMDHLILEWIRSTAERTSKQPPMVGWVGLGVGRKLSDSATRVSTLILIHPCHLDVAPFVSFLTGGGLN